MKNLLTAFVLLVSSVGFAKEQTLKFHCQAKHNFNIVIETDFVIADKSHSQIGEFEDFVIFFNQQDQFSELEIYNRSEESRSYAKSALEDGAGKLEFARWTRNYLFEISCQRK